MSFSKPIQTKTVTQAELQNGGLPALEDVYDFKRWNSSVDNPPRPANAFILFRTWLVLTRKQQFSNLKTHEFSTKLSLEWSSATKEVRDHFGHLSKLLKKKHNETYPDYKYRPQKTNKHESDKTESRRSKRNVKSPSSPPVDAMPGVEMSLTSLHTFGRDSTGDLILNTSLPGEFFASENAPLVYGPFWIAYPPSSTAQFSHAGSILLTNSTQALGNDPALAPDQSEILALISRNVNSTAIGGLPQGEEEFPNSTLSEPSETTTHDSMDVDHTSEGLNPADGFSNFALSDQVVQNLDSDLSFYSISGGTLADSVEWDPYPMLGYEAETYLHCNPLECPSMYYWQPVDTETYSCEDEQALDDFMAKYMNFDT